MPKRELIGHLPECPLCGPGFEMEVRLDKNGHPYAWCPDCTVQILTHGGHRAEKMRARMKPVEASQPEPEPPAPAAPAQPVPEPEPEPEEPEAQRPRRRRKRAAAGGGDWW